MAYVTHLGADPIVIGSCPIPTMPYDATSDSVPGPRPAVGVEGSTWERAVSQTWHKCPNQSVAIERAEHPFAIVNGPRGPIYKFFNGTDQSEAQGVRLGWVLLKGNVSAPVPLPSTDSGYQHLPVNTPPITPQQQALIDRYGINQQVLQQQQQSSLFDNPLLLVGGAAAIVFVVYWFKRKK